MLLPVAAGESTGPSADSIDIWALWTAALSIHDCRQSFPTFLATRIVPAIRVDATHEPWELPGNTKVIRTIDCNHGNCYDPATTGMP